MFTVCGSSGENVLFVWCLNDFKHAKGAHVQKKKDQKLSSTYKTETFKNIGNILRYQSCGKPVPIDCHGYVFVYHRRIKTTEISIRKNVIG